MREPNMYRRADVVVARPYPHGPTYKGIGIDFLP